MFYDRELKAIKRADRYRQREIFDENLKDFASNDYLSLSTKKTLFKAACNRVLKYDSHASKASSLVNGYHPIHKEFEEYISKINNFEKALCVGSGFLANISLFEALPRRGDLLIMDEDFHASGILAAKTCEAKVLLFKHNDPTDLKKKIANFKKISNGRVIVAVEGVYSMRGDLLNKNIFEIADEYGAILVVDEAHSVGVLGENLLGIFEYYGIMPKKNHIKMGTLGKALGSYGAYILSSFEIYDYLVNRAKAVIYATASSPFDISLALEGFLYIEKRREKYREKIKKIKKEAYDILGLKTDSLILPIYLSSIKELLRAKEIFLKNGFLAGFIRPPTVKKPMIRIILRVDQEGLKDMLYLAKRDIL